METIYQTVIRAFVKGLSLPRAQGYTVYEDDDGPVVTYFGNEIFRYYKSKKRLEFSPFFIFGNSNDFDEYVIAANFLLSCLHEQRVITLYSLVEDGNKLYLHNNQANYTLCLVDSTSKFVFNNVDFCNPNYAIIDLPVIKEQSEPVSVKTITFTDMLGVC